MGLLLLFTTGSFVQGVSTETLHAGNNAFSVKLRVFVFFPSPLVVLNETMALAPYRMAGAALAAGAGYQGYIQALPILEVVIDPRSIRSFFRRQIRKLAAWAMEGEAKEPEQGKSQPKPCGTLPAGGENPQPWMLEGLRQLAAQNQGWFTFLSLAVLWVCAQTMQILAGTCWAVTTAISWVWSFCVLLYRLIRWPVLAIARIGSGPEDDNGAARCIHLCRCHEHTGPRPPAGSR